MCGIIKGVQHTDRKPSPKSNSGRTEKQGPQAEQAGQTAQGQSAEGRLAALLRTHNDRYIDRALAELRARGVAFHLRSDEEILQKILQNEGNRYVRRLFCVAMTRTRNRVYFIAPLQEPSEFLLEFLRDYKNVRLDAFVEGAEQKTETDSGLSNLQENSGRLNLQENAGQKTAPADSRQGSTSDDSGQGNLQDKAGLPDLPGGRMSVLKCDRCTDGYLIVRVGRKSGEAFLGCTNYTRDGKGCGRTMGWPEYQQKMRYEPGYRDSYS